MIDIESFVFSRVSEKLRNTFDDIFVSGEYIDAPAKFPAVTLIEVNNSVLPSMRTTTVENGTTVLYEVNVFSNKIGYKKSEAKDILEIIDAEMSAIGFMRTMAQPTPNLADSTIYRITARYSGVIVPEYGVDGITYRIYST